MLSKVIAIKNVGKFRDCAARGDVEFRKLTLIYAENGRGKTTLCAILRSLQSSIGHYILERKTLGVTDAPEVQIRVDNATATFRDGAWSHSHRDIAVFDSTFVHENVYAGDYIDHEHKKNLYRVIVGEQGVSLARTVDNLDEQIRAANKEINEAKADVQRVIPAGVPLETFLALTADEEIDDKLAKKTAEVSALGRATEIAAKAAIATVALPQLPADFSSLLAKELQDVSTDAEALVQRQVAQHLDEHGETWLSQGLDYVQADACPFCGQLLNTNSLIAAYRTFFGEAYRNLKQEVNQLGQRIASIFGDTGLLRLQKTIAGNQTLFEFWKQFVKATLVDLSFDDELQPNLGALQEAALALVHQKQAAPLEPVTPSESFASAQRAIAALQPHIDAYNAAVNAINIEIAAKKTATASGDLNKAKRDLALVTATKRRYESDAVAACNKYQEALATKARLEIEKVEAKQRLDDFSAAVFAKYQSSINKLLGRFNAGFRIAETKRSYIGGRTSSTFQIVINDTAIDVGDATTPAGTPCFKNTLSSGDRSTLALAFFLAQLEHDADISQKLVAFDDPFTSQDRFRRICTQQEICRCCERAKQVVVLSHDPHFLKLVWDKVPSAQVRTLQFARAGQDTTINEWDIELETRGGYFQDHATLMAYQRDGTGASRDVVRSIRPLLEGFLRIRFPNQFLNSEWLGDFIRKIREADNTSTLYPAKGTLEELDAINDYSKRYHHEQNPGGFTNEPIDDSELQGFVKRTLTLVGGF